ncbi:hypothetical protein F4818DRAFT_444641 [Hypoxylon cercidicola]|nr:hypothetical protein F4818DRAFT_444641 [Hypoxylon cercidicola]
MEDSEMDAQDVLWCEGYKDIRVLTGPDWLQAGMLLRQQRPRHSGIKLLSRGQESESGGEPSFSCYDVDVLIVAVRMLLSMGFAAKGEHANSPILSCAWHNFGWNRNADYVAKGMLLSKLFPEDHEPSTLKGKLTIERLFDHPEIKAAIFSSPDFALRETEEFVGPRDASIVEELNAVAHDPDSSHVHWDGSCDIGRAASRQAGSIQLEVVNEDRVHVRYSGRPRFIRVTYVPATRTSPRFEDLKRFKLTAPCLIRPEVGETGQVEDGNDTYCLSIVVRVGREAAQSTVVDTDIRLYDGEGDPIHGDRECLAEFRPLWNTKLRPQESWTVGTKGYRYILFYSRMFMDETGRERAATPPPPRGTVGELLPQYQDAAFLRPRMGKAPTSREGEEE